MKKFVTFVVAAFALAIVAVVPGVASAGHGGGHGGGWHGGGHWAYGRGWHGGHHGYSGPRYGYRGWRGYGWGGYGWGGWWGPAVGIYIGPGYYGRRCWSPA
jgi:hypothetical protein